MDQRRKKIDSCWEFSVTLVQEHGRVVNTNIGQGHLMTLTYSDGHKLIINELCSEVPVSVNIKRSAENNYYIDIDSDDDTTTAFFKVTKDGGKTTLFTVNEDSSISFKNGMTISAAGVLADVTVDDPTLSQQISSKEYVDTAIAFIEDFFLLDTASDIGGIYYVASNDSGLIGGEGTFTVAGLGTGDGQALTNFATISTQPGVLALLTGIYGIHIHVAKTAGQKSVKIYFELYTRTAGGTETLRATSELSDFITTKTDATLHATVLSDVDINSTDRLVWKFFANVSAQGSAATVVLYVEGTNNSHTSVPTTTAVLDTRYTRHDLATAASDFLVASGAGAFVKKTLAQTGAILESDIIHNNVQGLTAGDPHTQYHNDTRGDARYEKFPVGAVVMYAGSWTNNVTIIGWYICDGNNGTPNLANKFIRSESSSGNTGGADTHALSEAELAAHAHTASKPCNLNTVSSPAGSHSAWTENAGVATSAIVIGSTGNGTAHENMPAYYSLIFIMKRS